MNSRDKRKIAKIQIGKSLEDRGCLFFLDFEEAPFDPKRVFIVNEVPDGQTRGAHAHHLCEQFLICTKGRIVVIIDDGYCKNKIELFPGEGIIQKAKEWGGQTYYDDAELLVLCSHKYDPSDYIRTYEEFEEMIKNEI